MTPIIFGSPAAKAVLAADKQLNERLYEHLWWYGSVEEAIEGLEEEIQETYWYEDAEKRARLAADLKLLQAALAVGETIDLPPNYRPELHQ